MAVSEKIVFFLIMIFHASVGISEEASVDEEVVVDDDDKDADEVAELVEVVVRLDKLSGCSTEAAADVAISPEVTVDDALEAVAAAACLLGLVGNVATGMCRLV
jgi:hypothetical protein